MTLAEPTPKCLIEDVGGCCGVFVASEGFSGLAPEVPAAPSAGLAYERSAARWILPRGVARKRCEGTRATAIRSARRGHPIDTTEEQMRVVIGIDPHKQSHQAVALDAREDELSRLEVRATKTQMDRLVKWAAPFPEWTWAIESAGGLGYLLPPQLVAAGEHVVDVPATLASRVRLLGSGRSNKNDANDARSVAIAALRSPGLATVERADHRVVLRILAKRNVDLGREQNRTSNRLHALICELVPAGITKRIRVSAARKVLDNVRPTSPAAAARHAMALELLDDLRRVDAQLAESKRRIADAVAVSKTSLTDIFGVGLVIAAMCIGFTGDVRRFPNADRFAAYNGTAPIEVSSA